MYKQVLCKSCGLDWDIQFIENGLCEECREKQSSCQKCRGITWESEEVKKQVCEECKRPECKHCGQPHDEPGYSLCLSCYEKENEA